MKFKIMLLSLFVLGLIMTLYLFEMAGAVGVTQTVSPTVTVSNTLSLTMEDTNNVNWGSHAAGTNVNGTIQARISANENWKLVVQATAGYPSTNELTDGNHKIPSSRLTYTSAAGDPVPQSGSGMASATPFDGSNQSNVWTGGLATTNCSVAITYNLQIPADQYPGTYNATHTYTLLPGP